MSIHDFKIFCESDNTRLALTWLSLVYISICGMCDLPGSPVLPYPIWVNLIIVVVICCFKASLATLSVRLCRKHKILHPATMSAVTAYCILCLINAVTYGIYGMGITIKLITVLSQTNGNEVMEFIPSLASNMWAVLRNPITYVAIVLILLSLIYATRVSKRIFLIVVTVSSSIGLVTLVTVICSISSGRTNFSVAGRTIKSIWWSYKEHKQIEMYLTTMKPLRYQETVRSRHLADVYMVVGESASRGHLSIYGYPLDTSPVLRKTGNGLIVFDNVIGSSTATAFNMDRILTFLSDRDNATRWSESATLFSVLSKAGYYTAWISNQEKSGMWSNPTLALVSDADLVSYVGSISSDDATMFKYDEAVLTQIERLSPNENKPRFIGVHLMGSHTEYWKRYPESYSVFNSDSILGIKRDFKLSRSHAATVAEYDNSIYYTDYILGRIIGYVNSSKRPAIMIYFSDHGENVYDDSNDFRGRDTRHVKVPFVIYTNHQFRENCPDLYCRLAKASSKPFSTANTVHLICSLTGTEYHLYDSTRDVSSPRYVSLPRYVDDKVWDYEPTESAARDEDAMKLSDST